jgi:hypothetical protein
VSFYAEFAEADSLVLAYDVGHAIVLCHDCVLEFRFRHGLLYVCMCVFNGCVVVSLFSVMLFIEVSLSASLSGANFYVVLLLGSFPQTPFASFFCEGVIFKVCHTYIVIRVK